jgi:hypothetical protein
LDLLAEILHHFSYFTLGYLRALASRFMQQRHAKHLPIQLTIDVFQGSKEYLSKRKQGRGPEPRQALKSTHK